GGGSFSESVRVGSSAFKSRRRIERVAHVQRIAAADRPTCWRKLGALRALRALRRQLSSGVGRQILVTHKIRFPAPMAQRYLYMLISRLRFLAEQPCGQ